MLKINKLIPQNGIRLKYVTITRKIDVFINNHLYQEKFYDR